MKKLYRRLLDICYENKLHHLGSYFSCLHIIDEIYRDKNEDDIFILSNGHAVVALYVVLEKYYGLDAQELLDKYGEHPKRNELDRIHCSTGSLGMGICVAVGRAVGNPNRHVHVMISDGESNEGSVWEALTKIDGLYVEVHDFEERGMMAENFNKISDHLKGFGKTVEKLQADCMLVY